MAMIDNTKHLSQYIESKKNYLNYNVELFDIYEGNLRIYVDQILESSLSPKYYSQIKDRIYPINILKRIIDKISRVYANDPVRTATSNQEILEYYEQSFFINQKMNRADEFLNLFKGYALEPYLREGTPTLRVLPFDRFLVESDSLVDQTIMTRFYKYVGKHTKNERGQDREVDVWFVYTDDEFVAMDQDGLIVPEFMTDGFGNELQGENPLGFIPFYYSNLSEYKTMPTQDTDTLALSKLMPVQISDLSGTILFQCFSIVWGLDIEIEKAVMSPNSIWSLKSDPNSDKQPQVGVITPVADVDKVLNFIGEAFSLWMESRGIRVGAIGTAEGTYNTSGISKIIDEMDTFETVKKQMSYFKRDESRFWELTRLMNNYWAESGQLTTPVLPESWEVSVEFDEPKPAVSRDVEVDIALKERDGGIISTETAIKKLYPDWTEEEVQKEMQKVQNEQFPTIGGEADGKMAEV